MCLWEKVSVMSYYSAILILPPLGMNIFDSIYVKPEEYITEAIMTDQRKALIKWYKVLKVFTYPIPPPAMRQEERGQGTT